MTDKLIFLVGFMGSGKSTTGWALASRLSWEVLDLDQEIEMFASCSIPEIFAQQGEGRFRCLETEVLAQLPGKTRLVVATGGGIVEKEQNWELMRQCGVTVFLDVPWAELQRRLEKNTGRPLADDKRPEEIHQLFQRRLPLYRQADIIIASDGGRSPEKVVDLILEQFKCRKCTK